MSTNNTVHVCLVMDYRPTNGPVYVDTDIRLHYRGSDVTLYANTWPQAAHAQDTPVFTNILNELFDSRSGVEMVSARPFRLVITASSAVSGDQILEQVKRGVRNSGFRATSSNKLSRPVAP